MAVITMACVLYVLAQPVRHHLGHRPALAGQARPEPLPLLLVQPEGQQPPGALRVHLAAASARSGTGPGSAASPSAPSSGTWSVTDPGTSRLKSATAASTTSLAISR